MTDIATIAGPVPEIFFIEDAILALDDRYSLMTAFYWKKTPQGFNYWQNYCLNSHPNPKEARAILRYWIYLAEASTATTKETTQ